MTIKRNMQSSDINNAYDIIFRGIRSITYKYGNWTGTMTSLASALTRVLSKRQRTFLPSSPATLRVIINQITNRLRSRGISVKFGRTPDHNRTRFVKFVW
jgi:hypothetical protein